MQRSSLYRWGVLVRKIVRYQGLIVSELVSENNESIEESSKLVSCLRAIVGYIHSVVPQRMLINIFVSLFLIRPLDLGAFNGNGATVM